MNRRTFVKAGGLSTLAAVMPQLCLRGAPGRLEEAYQALDKQRMQKLADMALSIAKRRGASYADFRVCRYQNDDVNTREEHVESIHSSRDFGFGVRVLINGTWGFSSSSRVTEAKVDEMTRHAVDMAQANHPLQKQRVELESIPAYQDIWVMPMKRDPFTVPIEEKVQKLLAINSAAQRVGAAFCNSGMSFVREEKFFASTGGSSILQVRVRTQPHFTVTVVDKKTGKFENCNSYAAPRGSGYEYIESYDFEREAARASKEASQKISAKSVVPGKKDLVIHPTNLWLTIHESVGHPTELDRALGYEANFAGTSFVTKEKLGKLQYGSKHITIIGDRTQEGGLSTVAYDDDGVKTGGSEFPIIKQGRFENYQMAMGYAKAVGRSGSNGCAYADGWDKFPIQRMPNISLQPNPLPVSLDELLSDVKDGIYIMGNGSWSIDQQRYNFQFGGQVFYEIKNGKLGQMLRDVAYQGNTVDFWNACDGLCGKAEYHLGGTFSCGKAQPEQSAPVSHGAVPARFRKINVINTNRSDI
ncbi:MAG TPA: TldD/PmbA family protein [Candidatus Saccharimonadales bacterium]|nr:TldD/PmbA family protein [Candidatus Saccharimonadales bacterium]